MITNEKMLTTRQKQILEYIRTCVHQFGYPPSVREICKEVGLSSTSTVHGYLHRLEDLGYIRRDPAKNRTIELLDEGSWRSKKIVPPAPSSARSVPELPSLPRNASKMSTPSRLIFIGNDDCFMLIVQGDSMKNAGILEGDQLIVRHQDTAENGEIVVALIDDEATVKRYFREKDAIRLQPENDEYEPIYTRNCKILGKVVGLYRQY